jgi:hypothetical protein
MSIYLQILLILIAISYFTFYMNILLTYFFTKPFCLEMTDKLLTFKAILNSLYLRFEFSNPILSVYFAYLFSVGISIY